MKHFDPAAFEVLLFLNDCNNIFTFLWLLMRLAFCCPPQKSIIKKDLIAGLYKLQVIFELRLPFSRQ